MQYVGFIAITRTSHEINSRENSPKLLVAHRAKPVS
uniref:Protein HID1 n=1 Tax=Mesocestoides corti TaxID=53468 RepID=A0A5K3FC90_MESCO